MVLAEDSIPIYLNNDLLRASKGIIVNGSTLVPLRNIFKALGAKVDWDADTQTVIANKLNTSIQLQINQKVAYINGEPVELSAQAQIINGSTYVPLRFISEAFDCSVSWNPNSRSVNITRQAKVYLTEEELFKDIIKAVQNNKLEIIGNYKNLQEFNNLSNYKEIADAMLCKSWELTNFIPHSVIYTHVYITHDEFDIIYTYDEKLKELYSGVKEKAEQIIEQIIKPDMSDYEKIKAIHDYLVVNTEYDYDNYLSDTLSDESFLAYGVLINGIGVCSGYSEAFYILSNMVGIDCLMVEGEANDGNHGWNMVRIDGQIKYIDVTWDDPIPDRGNNIIYDYFLITEEKISIDHEWDKELYSEDLLDLIQ